MGFEVVGDVGGMWQEATQSVSSGLSGLGASELASTTQRLADSLDIIAGTAQIIAVAASLRETYNGIQTARAAANTALRAANPLTWPSIAIALSAAGIASAFVYGIMRSYEVKADLSTSSGITAMGQTLGAIA